MTPRHAAPLALLAAATVAAASAPVISTTRWWCAVGEPVTLRMQRGQPFLGATSELTKPQSVFLILFIAATLGLSATLLKEATPREAALILIQATCVLAIIAILEGVGRGRPGRS